MTNLGTLPTNFAEPTDCAVSKSDIFHLSLPTPPYYHHYYLQGPLAQTSCYPSGYNGQTQQYYSPAQCPTGFTTACLMTSSLGTGIETIATCCPTQYNFACETSIHLPWQTTLACSTLLGGKTVAWQVIFSETDSAEKTSIVTLSTDGLNAYGIQVRYQSFDFPTLTPLLFSSSTPSPSMLEATPATTAQLPAPSSPTQSSLASSPSVSANTPSPSLTYGSDSHSGASSGNTINPGMGVGIYLGVFAGVLIISAIIYYLIRRAIIRRNRQRQKGGLFGISLRGHAPAVESGSMIKIPGTHELTSIKDPVELGSDRSR
ncbi:hypothetical protein F4777DRAFT_561155 [Nemania sp. FL0916]|nr:hypothetical protein F4777DRAFT_561155 [Nemania sp. FL0916]